jgi:hypothetical protein
MSQIRLRDERWAQKGAELITYADPFLAIKITSCGIRGPSGPGEPSHTGIASQIRRCLRPRRRQHIRQFSLRLHSNGHLR